MPRLLSLTVPFLAAAFCVASIPARAEVLIVVDKTVQQMTVSVDGQPRWVWPVSTGRAGYATPSGRFRPFRMEADHYSKEWDEAPMPYSIFFTMEGHAIHGSFETKNLGRRASHGCIRLSPQHAAALYALVRERGVSDARVVVTNSSEPLVAGAPQPETTAAGWNQTNPALTPYAYAPEGGYAPTQPYGRKMLEEPEPVSYAPPPPPGRKLPDSDGEEPAAAVPPYSQPERNQ